MDMLYQSIFEDPQVTGEHGYAQGLAVVGSIARLRALGQSYTSHSPVRGDSGHGYH